MLSLLVLGVLTVGTPQGAVLPHRTPADVAGLLDSLAQPFAPQGPQGTWGTVTRGDARASVTMTTHYGPNGDEKTGWISAIDLPSRGRHQAATTPTVVVSHLGRTATAEKHIEFAEPLSRDQVRADVREFWRTAEAFARVHRGRFVPGTSMDPTQGPLPDDLVLDKADEGSLFRVTDAWGLRKHGGWGGSFSGWAFPIDLDGRSVWVYENNQGPLPRRTSFLLIGSVAIPKGLDAHAWGSAHLHAADDLSLSYANDQQAPAIRTIDLSHGPTLGDLRARFQAFSRDLAALERKLVASPVDGSALPR